MAHAHALGARSSVAARAGRPGRVLPMAVCVAPPRRHVALASSAASVMSADNDANSGDSMEGEVRVPWYNKPNPFVELETLEELQEKVKQGGKFSVVDYYAGWCSSCKSSFPALCKIPKNPDLAKSFNFYKANIEKEEFLSFTKSHGIRGIPHMQVFSPEGKAVAGFSASFKKMQMVQKNLAYIAKATDLDFIVDPNGFVVSRSLAGIMGGDDNAAV